MKMRESGLPFDDIRNLLANLPDPNAEIADLARQQAKDSAYAADDGFSQLCNWYALWSGRTPAVHRPLLTLFAGTHGVDRSNESWLYEQVSAIASGEASVNRLCSAQDIGLKIFDLALQIPVNDISVEPALDEKSCAGTIAFGMEAIAGGTDLLCLSAVERAPGPSVIAILSILLELPIADVALGFGQEAAGERDLLEKIVERGRQYQSDPLELLRQIGGRETAAICGAVLAGRSEHIPMLLSGPSAIASAVVLACAQDDAVNHCLLAHDITDGALKDRLGPVGLLPGVTKQHSADPTNQVVTAAAIVKLACLSHPSAGLANG